MAYVSLVGVLGRRPVQKYRATGLRHPTANPTRFICTTCAARRSTKVVIGRFAYAGVERVESDIHLWIIITVNGRVEKLVDECVADDFMTCSEAAARLKSRAELSGYKVLTSREWEMYQN